MEPATKKWNNLSVVHPSHVAELDQKAMSHVAAGMPEHRAQLLAYNDYKNKQHLDAAAYHLKSANNMARNGQKSEAEKHLALYKMHSNIIGSGGKHVPPEVMSAMPRTQENKNVVFQSHLADGLIV